MTLRAVLIPTALLCMAMGACQSTEYIHVGENWDALQNLEPDEKVFDVELTTDESLKLGDKLTVKVRSAKQGKLWIIRVDPDDEVSLLYPNDYVEEHDIAAGKWLQVPGASDRWALEADEPTGKSIVAAIVTTGDADLDEILGTQKSVPKAIRVVEATPAWGIGKVVISVEEE